jgi:hypothetical protein
MNDDDGKTCFFTLRKTVQCFSIFFGKSTWKFLQSFSAGRFVSTQMSDVSSNMDITALLTVVVGLTLSQQ